jgi:hypothetical protein
VALFHTPSLLLPLWIRQAGPSDGRINVWIVVVILLAPSHVGTTVLCKHIFIELALRGRPCILTTDNQRLVLLILGLAMSVRVPFVLDINEIAAKLPAARGIQSAIHPDDFIFRCLLKPEAAVAEYLRNGLESAGKLSALLSEYLPKQKVSLLEFASGYGCVTRHIAKVMPDVDLICCDIHEAAISFIREELGAAAVISHSVPEKLDLGRTQTCSPNKVASSNCTKTRRL